MRAERERESKCVCVRERARHAGREEWELEVECGVTRVCIFNGQECSVTPRPLPEIARVCRAEQRCAADFVCGGDVLRSAETECDTK
eukprot:24344-Rhodomonas_salina.1